MEEQNAASKLDKKPKSRWPSRVVWVYINGVLATLSWAYGGALFNVDPKPVRRAWFFIFVGFVFTAVAFRLWLINYRTKHPIPLWLPNVSLFGTTFLGMVACLYAIHLQQPEQHPAPAPPQPQPTENAEWLPPELPKDCDHVVVGFGSQGIVYGRLMAEISSQGTRFLRKDLPDFLTKDMDKMPNYSPRDRYMWVKDYMAYSIAGIQVPFPVQPVVISNRMYVEVEIPFLNKKRKIVMSDTLDKELPIPNTWDRNYSTNAGIYAYEIVNELTNPVLQVFYTAPNEVHVNGIFMVATNHVLVSFGQEPILGTFNYKLLELSNSTPQRLITFSLQGTNFSEAFRIYTNDSPATIGELMTNEFYRAIFPGQIAVFKYPSYKYPSEFADWIKIAQTNAAKASHR